MRRSTARALVTVSILPVAAFGSEDKLEEVVVTASFTGITSSKAAPVHILTGDDVTTAGVQSLGEHIDSLLGVSTADFGAAVGHPIIRGMSGTRVKVLNNGTVVRDVSGLGVDHPVDANLSHLQQIEIVRGPSALMYSNGSVGGIVNIVDDSIPMTDLERFSGSLGGEAQDVNNGGGLDATVQGNFGGINFTYSFQESDFENYDIPSGAILEDHDEHDEDHDDHDEDHEDDHGAASILANSDTENTSHRFGLSKAGEWGYIGISYNDVTNHYGIPFHGDDHGAHGGHDDHDDDHDDHDDDHDDHDDDHDDHDDDHDDHDDDHDDHDDDHDDHDGGHDEHEGERIFSQTESETLTLRGSINTSFALVNSIDFIFKETDYELMEGHAEAEGHGEGEHEDEHEDEHDGHGHAEGPTVFTNESTELQLGLDLSSGGEKIRRIVFNYADEETAIIGAEAFMAPVDSTELTLGFFTSDDIGFADLDLGFRFDRIERDGFIAEMHEDEHHDEDHEEDDHDDHDGDHDDEHHEDERVFEPQSFDESAFSAAMTLRKDISDRASLSLGLSSVSKVPSSIELFMDGAHLATGRYEVGSIALDTERSNSIDLSFDFEGDVFYAMGSIYHNSIDNYIYLRDELEEEHDEHMEEEHHDDEGHHDDHDDEHHDDEHMDHGNLTLANYTQQDADFTGYEIEVGARFSLPAGQLQLSLARDEVDAEFSNGEDVPRIVPARNIFTARYTLDDFSAKLLIKDVERQTNVAPGESFTDGFTLVNADASWSYGFDDTTRLTLTAFARNLTDEVARNHASFVKDQVPLPGRNIGFRFRLDF